MSVPAFKINLRRSGAATAFTNEASSTIGVTASTVYPNKSRFQVTSTVRQVWDRDTAFIFRESTSSTAEISSTDLLDIDFLFGKAQFKSSHANVFMTGNYVPMSFMTGANSFSMTMASDVLDDTDFSETQFRSKRLGVKDVNLTVSRFDDATTFFDDLLTGSSVITVGQAIVAELQLDPPSGAIGRGFFKVETHNRTGDVASLESAEVNMSLDGKPTAVGEQPGRKDFSWNDI